MDRGRARAIAALAVFDENFGDLRMAHRLAAVVGQKVLLGDIGDVFGFVVLREQMIERLILMRPDLGRDRLVPFLRIVENRIDVEDDAAKRIKAVPDNLADLIFGDPESCSFRCLTYSPVAGGQYKPRLWRGLA